MEKPSTTATASSFSKYLFPTNIPNMASLSVSTDSNQSCVWNPSDSDSVVSIASATHDCGCPLTVDQIYTDKYITDFINSISEVVNITGDKDTYFYNLVKSYGSWYNAKTLVKWSSAEKDRKRTATAISAEWLCDVLNADMLRLHGQNIDAVEVIYVQDMQTGVTYRFAGDISAYFIENFRIPVYKPDGFLFASNNTWAHKLVVIAGKYMYTSNGYINAGSAFV